MEKFLSLESYVTSVEGEENKDLVREALDTFATQVAPKLSLLRRGTIHNDVNKDNLLIEMSSDKFKISGLVDFGDIRHSCLLFELANSIAAFINEEDVLLVSGYLLAGYQAVYPLPGLEFDLLYDVVSARLCQVFLITSNHEKECLNNDYLRKLLTDYLGKFKAWLSNSKADAVAFWRKVEFDANFHDKEYYT
ncbi:hydroxylysine kinase-like [Orbicella faveolata]|uniref:hydroxylysine kinase-like n=1 Tax=Orbicella faveolata TaxID=48498 RepID=UPI0009E51130|nr:hydroxylysine kinase-like [Orbicella faveolata]